MRQMTTREEGIVDRLIRRHREDVTWKTNFAKQCEEVAALIFPEYRNTFFFQSYNWPGTKRTQLQVDATGMHSLGRFAAFCDSLVTPRNLLWHGIEPEDQSLMRDRATRLYCDGLADLLFRERYKAASNFVGQNHANWLQLGAFGTHGMLVEGIDPAYGSRFGLAHIAAPMSQLFIRQNAQGRIVAATRWARFTAEQMVQQYGRENVSADVLTRLEQESQYPFSVLHCVYLRDEGEYDPERLDVRGMRWASCEVDYDSKWLLRESGYHTFPFAIGRYLQMPGEVYGRSIAMRVLPSLKTLNAQKRAYLKQAHRAVDPVLLTMDDGLASSLNMRPGAVNPGGMSTDGKPLIGVLPTGQIQVAIEMMELEANIIKAEFFEDIMQIAADPRVMSATEVIERVSEKGQILAPTIGRQEAEYVGPLVERELDVLYRQGVPQRVLGPMPRALRDAGGALKVVHTSPLSRAARAQEAAGLVRTIESIGQLVGITGDKTPLYQFNDDVWPREIAYIQAVPERYMAPRSMVEAKKRAAAQEAAAQKQIQAAPAQAAIMKAQAAVQKNQMEQGAPFAPPLSSQYVQ